jgi:mono/diheme cytochrome c family protein
MTGLILNLRRFAALTAVACCAFLAGCGEGHVRFHLDRVAADKFAVGEAQQQQIADVLTAAFGTPDEPVVMDATGLDIDMIRRASGPVHRDALEGPKGLYREHCVHCHGINGDGAGTTAAFLNPYPRDYRKGWYKEKSTKREERPTTDNLMRTLHEGIAGTAMPTFRLLPEGDRRALVEYVKYLDMRGELELRLDRWVHDNFKKPDEKNPEKSAKEEAESAKKLQSPEVVLGQLNLIAAAWQDPIQVAVEDRPESLKFDKIADETKRKEAKRLSIEIGFNMFTHDGPGSFPWTTQEDGHPVTRQIAYLGAACIKCHGPTALGDGQTTDFDDWTKFAWDKETWKPQPLPDASELLALGALPQRNAIPRNLRQGIYRFGRRPLDIYYRIHEGIKGVPMPAAELLTQEDKDKLKKIRKDADDQFKKKFPDLEISEDDSDDVQETKLRKKAEFIAKIVDPQIEKMQGERIWHLVDYVLSLPYGPGGELGLDATYSPTKDNIGLYYDR